MNAQARQDMEMRTLIALPPASPLMRDLYILSQHFMPVFRKRWDVKGGACIATACVLADVLRRLGYKAEPLPVVFVAENRPLTKQKPLGQPTLLVIGDPEDVQAEGRFRGHMAVLVHSEGASYVVDASLVQAQRLYLPDLPEFLALPFSPTNEVTWKDFRSVMLAGVIDTKHDVSAAYYLMTAEDREEWKTAPDADPAKRRSTVSALAERVRKKRRAFARSAAEVGIDKMVSLAAPGPRHMVYGLPAQATSVSAEHLLQGAPR